MGRIVADTTPIIYLAKVAQLHLLRSLYQDVVTPSEIKRELLVGGHPEVPLIRDAYRSGWLEEAPLDQPAKSFLTKQLGETPSLHEGERQAIALARTRELPLLIDEDGKTGRRIARVWGVEVKGTLRVILEAYEAGLVEYEEARKLFRKLLAERFRVSADIYDRALSLLETAKKIQ